MSLKILIAAAVSAVAVAAYIPSLDSPFHFDDAIFLQDGNVREQRWQEFLWPPEPRFLTWLTFLAQYRLHGPDPFPFHVFNVVVHGLNGALVFFVLTALLKRKGRGREVTNRLSRSVTPGLALFGALIFVLHPLQSEAVVYVYQRSTLMGSLFAFLALLVWIKRPIRGSKWWGAAAMGFFLLAVGCKESLASLPAALWVYDGLYRKEWRPDRWLWGMLAAAAVLGAAYLYWSEFRLGPSLAYSATQVKVWLRYLLLVLGISSQSVDHAVAPQNTLADPLWWWSLLALTAMAGWAWRMRSAHPPAALAIAWWSLLLAPTSSFIGSPDFMFEHRMYAPMLGVSVLAAAALGVLGKRSRSFFSTSASKWLQLSAASAALVLCSVGNLRRQQVWESPRALWTDAAFKAPGKYRPNFNLGVVLMKESPRQAERFLTRAIQIEPSVPLAYRSLGKVKFDAGDLDAAESLWRQAVLLDPSDHESLLALGVVYARRRDFNAAEQKFQEASRLSPYSAEPRLQLSRLQLQFGFVEKAIESAEAGLQFNPADARLLFALADAVSQAANWARAAELYRKGLELAPENAAAWMGAARALWETGQSEAAAAAAQRAIERADGEDIRDRARRLLRQIRLSGRRR